jgi:dTDP-4-amino-4,6-dideoxygalactose transaminase
LNRRREVAQRYRAHLKGVGLFKEFSGSALWAFPILVDRRDDFKDAMESRGVEISLVQVRNDLYRVFGGKRLELPHMGSIESRYVYLPCHPLLSDDQVAQVIRAVNQGW